MGHVELVGLDHMPLTMISERTFVSVADIQAANKLPSGQTEVNKGTIVVPGVSYHHIITGDTKTTIAEQHGVTEAALEKANSWLKTWTSLSAGMAILIPAH